MCVSPICEIYELLFKFGETPGGQALIGSVAGAFGGAWAVIKMQERKEALQDLAFFNFAISAFSSHVNSLLNLRAQIAIPFRDEVNGLLVLVKDVQKRKAAGQKIMPPVDLKLHLSTQLVHETKIDFLVDIQNLGKYSNVAPKLIPWVAHAKSAIENVFEQINKKNEMVIEIRSCVREGGRVESFLGVEVQEGNHDNRLEHIARNLDQAITDAIFFLTKTIKGVQDLSSIVLRENLRKKVATTYTREEYKSLMPSDDYIKGWD